MSKLINNLGLLFHYILAIVMAVDDLPLLLAIQTMILGNLVYMNFKPIQNE